MRPRRSARQRDRRQAGCFRRKSVYTGAPQPADLVQRRRGYHNACWRSYRCDGGEYSLWRALDEGARPARNSESGPETMLPVPARTGPTPCRRGARRAGTLRVPLLIPPSLMVEVEQRAAQAANDHQEDARAATERLHDDISRASRQPSSGSRGGLENDDIRRLVQGVPGGRTYGLISCMQGCLITGGGRCRPRCLAYERTRPGNLARQSHVDDLNSLPRTSSHVAGQLGTMVSWRRHRITYKPISDITSSRSYSYWSAAPFVLARCAAGGNVSSKVARPGR